MNAPDTTAAYAPAKVPDSQQMVLDALVVRKRHGIDRMTAGDIREFLEQVHAPRRFDKGWVTGRLDSLRDSGLVECTDELRLDPRTKRSSQLWRLPVVQARMFA